MSRSCDPHSSGNSKTSKSKNSVVNSVKSEIKKFELKRVIIFIGIMVNREPAHDGSLKKQIYQPS